jgi:outer membrane protein OmpA-like peptidoglycan-associated protein
MNVNLLSLATQALGGDFGKLAGQFMGESPEATQSGLGAILPALIGGMVSKGATLDGASSLLGMLNGPNVNSNLLGDVAGLFGNGGAQATSLLGTGATLLSGLFGDKVGGLASAVSGLAGIKAGSATNLLGLVAPLIFGMMRKHTSDNGLNASGLMDLLKGQSNSLQGALKPEISKALGFASPLAFLSGGAATAAAAVTGAASHATGAATAAVSNVTASGGSLIGKLLPWIIGGLVALFLLSQMKSCGGTAKVEAPAPTPAPAPVATAPAPAPAPAPAVAPEPAPAAAPASTTAPMAKPEAVKLYFATGKFEPPADTAKQVDKLVDYSRASPNAKVGISGFHDKQGDAAANAELAKQRAMGVKNVLISAGVPESAIIMNKPTETTGASDDKEARRVEVFVAQ